MLTRLPPTNHLNRDSIAEARSKTLTAILTTIKEFRDNYKNSTGISGCPGDTPDQPALQCQSIQLLNTPARTACDLIIYGSFDKALSELGCNDYLDKLEHSYSAEKFQNKSVYEVCNKLADVTIYYLPGHEVMCEIMDKVVENVSKFLDEVEVLDRFIGLLHDM